MRYIKLFEGRRKKSSRPQVNDFVILKFKYEEDEELIEFLAQNIGK